MLHNKKTKHFFRGFTLLEILVVIAVIGIVSSVILMSTGNARTEREVSSASQDVVGLLREAQQYALTGKQFVNSTDPCQFRVTWNSGSASLTTTYYYKGSNGVCDQSVTVSTFNLQGGVVFANSGVVDFSLPHGRPSFATPNVALQLSKAGVSGVACVYQSGLVKNALGTTNCP